MLPQKGLSFGQQFLPSLIMGGIEGAQQQRQNEYEKKILADILAGRSPTEAMTPAPQQGGLMGMLGNIVAPQPQLSNLSPFTQKFLEMSIAPKLEDPLQKRIREAQLGGILAGTEHTGAATTALQEETAGNREMRPLKMQNLKQELENRQQEIYFIKQTNPARARILQGQADSIEQQLAAEKEKRPLEIKRINLDLDIAQEQLDQAKDIAPMKKQYMQAQLNEMQNAVETKKTLLPLEVEQMQATIGQIKANTRLLTAKEGATETGKTMTDTELTGATKIADNLIQGAYGGHRWGPNYSKDALIQQYNKYKILMQYSIKSPSEQAALDQVWNSRTQGSDFEAQVAGQDGPAPTPGTPNAKGVRQYFEIRGDPNTGEQIGFNGKQWEPIK
jgi:hypothetical protein